MDFRGGSRIFPRGVRQLLKVLLFLKFFVENCMKMKEFGPGDASPWRPPLRSADGLECNLEAHIIPLLHVVLWFNVNGAYLSSE